MSAFWNSEELRAVTDRYAAAITPELAALIDPNDPSDPIARQFVPSLAELNTLSEERLDPIGDDVHSPVPGIVHRHKDRVLFKVVSACPVYCRFCFRRESVGPKRASALSVEQIDAAIAYIAAHPEVWEVIFTGGDPFILSPRRVDELTRRLAAIPHVKILRWHTRVPFVDPPRVNEELVAALQSSAAKTWVALHANHPREFTPAARAAIACLSSAGIPLVSQSVLLDGVNDDVATLETLMRAFVGAGVKPYYLHHPDLAPGTSHFRISIDEGQALMHQLRGRLSGLAMPAYVVDIPGGYGKVPLESSNVEKMRDGTWRIRDHSGGWHAYPPAL
jgi:lysine 2,3-aminomutase